MVELFGKCVVQATRGASWFQHPLLLAIRLYWGWALMLTGWAKFKDIGRVVAWFRQLDIPLPTEAALAVTSIEFAGSILLMIGLFARPAAAAIAIEMTVAYLTANSAVLQTVTKDFFCVDAMKLGDCITFAEPFPFWFAGLIVFAFGPGYFSIDAEVARWWTKATSG